MICPNCGERASFTEHTKTIRGSLGLTFEEDWGMDYHDETWLTCDKCGAKTDDEELKRTNRMPEEATA